MYEYQYFTVTGEGVVTTKYQEHREVIDRFAREGWQYVGWVPTCILSHGAVSQMDLIFQREV